MGKLDTLTAHEITNDEDHKEMVRCAQDRFYGMPTEDIISYLLVIVRKLPPDECDETSDCEHICMTGGSMAEKIEMMHSFAECVLQGHKKAFDGKLPK